MQKMPVMKQMMQTVEVCSPIQDDSMPGLRREAGALGADAVALAEAHSPARLQQHAGAFGLSAGVAMDLRLGWDLGLKADEVKA